MLCVFVLCIPVILSTTRTQRNVTRSLDNSELLSDEHLSLNKSSSSYFNNTTSRVKGDCPTISNCVSCWSDKCNNCKVGYYLNANNNGCIKCNVDQCLECNDKDQCSVCEDGMYFKGTEKQCQLCSTVLDHCTSCSNSTYCTVCTFGYFKSNGKCVSCDQVCGDEGCLPDSGRCINCNSTTVFNKEKTQCVKMENAHCTLSNNSYCIQCEISYLLIGVGCIKTESCTWSSVKFGSVCVSKYSVNCDTTYSKSCSKCNADTSKNTTVGHCETCEQRKEACSFCQKSNNNKYYCDACRKGFFPSGSETLCEPCSNMVGCVECANVVPTTVMDMVYRNCTKCLSTYYLEDGICKQLPNCFLQNNKTCVTCNVDYILTADGTCVEYTTISNCVSAVNNVCSSCNEGYYISSLNTCTPCTNNCMSCYGVSYVQRCTLCQKNYTLLDYQCSACSIEGCNECKNTDDKCLTCDEFHYSLNGKCSVCNNYYTNCLKCGQTRCSECKDNFYLSYENKCNPCSDIDGCVECLQTSPTCTTCADGYYLNSLGCQKCTTNLPNCEICSSQKSCDKCELGFYLTNQHTCETCTTINGCERCSQTDSKCLTCKDGYKATKVEGDFVECESCEQITANCKTCDSDFNCIECDSPLLLNTTGGNHCSECTLANCLLCSATSFGCETCESGYYRGSDLMCHSCSIDTEGTCKTCTSTTECSTCNTGYFIDGVTCKACDTITGCESCLTTSRECTKCVSGNYLDTDKTCKTCDTITNCSSCSPTSKVCTECDATKASYLYNDACLPCSSNCLHCTSTTCLECEENNYPSTAYCYPCSSMNGCLNCSNTEAKCEVCKEGGVDQTTFRCTTCKDANCNNCALDKTECTECVKGYFLNLSECYKCSEILHCVECSQNTTECTGCGSGYYLEATTCFSCDTAMTGCLTCTNKETCSSCGVGYHINTNNSCSSCSVSIPYCEKCSLSGDAVKCDVCDAYHYVDTIGHCALVSIGHYKSSHSTESLCSLQMSNCYSCNYSTLTNEIFNINELVCLLCHSGFSLKTESDRQCIPCGNEVQLNGVCTICDDGCSKCTTSTCVDCKEGYSLRGGVCHVLKNIDKCETEEIHNIGCETCGSGITQTGSCPLPLTTDECGAYEVTLNEEQCIPYYTQKTSTMRNEMKREDTCMLKEKGRCLSCTYGNGLTTTNPPTCGICEGCGMCTTVGVCKTCVNEYNDMKGDCLESLNCLTKTNNTCSVCEQGSVVIGGICSDCPLHCELCDWNRNCFVCSSSFILMNGRCLLPNEVNCSSTANGHCIQCISGKSLDSQSVCSTIPLDGCAAVFNSRCVLCDSDLQFGYNEMTGEVMCSSEAKISSCKVMGASGCIRCDDGFYVSGKKCERCDANCRTCGNSPSQCVGCYSGMTLNENTMTCVGLGELAEKCETFFPSNGCAFCKSGYYWKDRDCNKCAFECLQCIKNSTFCTECNFEGGYITRGNNVDGSTTCVHNSTFANCTLFTMNGCKSCEETFFVNENSICELCGSNCVSCATSSQCTNCSSGYVLVRVSGNTAVCKHYKDIPQCTGEADNKCTGCVGTNYDLSSDKTECLYHTNLFLAVGVPIIGVFVLVVLLFILISILVFYIYQRKKKLQKEAKICEFDMKHTNVSFETINTESGLVSNKKVLDFLIDSDGELVPVGVESRDLLCIGNKKTKLLKVQLSTKVGTDKYSIRTDPQIITLKKGRACEFQIFITPYCTCDLHEKIMLIALDMRKAQQYEVPINVHLKTQLTTRLDYDMLKEEKKIGEGSFGVVFKGKFREYDVAIKKMKNCATDNKGLEEFSKEVAMLDKFRSDYLVHFYGAVFIPNKICMVSEFCKYGSLQDLLKKRSEDFVSEKMKVKFMIDAAKGIEYLHNNGILHRDIKPDNFLIPSIEEDVPVNAKLTDFGTSRNINMMLTNMTFTKGIGTPTYMAPEILDKMNYKLSADIYSFAMTMLEVASWAPAFPANRFKHPWDVADFVTSGKRLPQPDNVSDGIFTVITNSWCPRSAERWKIEKIVEQLEIIYKGF
ncbi:protein serine/threonine kinase, putative [Entamoeba invadens IP1]|uniref:Protein serine/threonine kinase, putative n=1 Tax=Entamoeba invadens IP1 TaxID=370355 RepID=A0A0A1UGH2_ENTIV|nr:protein serine/threonine kinase, putative [Entamoeba invadens IP1]ELP92662.1 protein serine/threonine kinase, putative [Entamoeba invadens IP1]|eukprot:XP_004259433.1 protein serine/threonine kinase, putative [Entamoeba invadens IP1]